MHNKIDKFKNLLLLKQATINQSVTITDFVLRQHGISAKNKEHLTGEFGYPSIYNKKYRRINRIIDMIALLSSLAKEYHLKTNFDKNTVKKNHENLITRLLLHEFSLYTADKPLSSDQYLFLISNLEEIAKKLPENLFLLISSLPVMDKDANVVINQVIHIQCGHLPKIDTLAKITPSSDDPVYKGVNITKFTQEASDRISGNMILSDGNKPQLTSSYNGTINCETQGGAKFHTVIDICLDHLHAQGKKSLQNKFNLARKYDNDELIPYQVSHVITSNTVGIEKENAIVKNIVRVDPKNPYQADTFLTPSSDKKMIPVKFVLKKASKSIKSRDCKIEIQSIPKIAALEPTNSPSYLNANLNKKIVNRYRQMTIIKNENEIGIKHPPFGPSCSLFMYPPIKLETLDESLKWRVDQLNERSIYHALEKHTGYKKVTREYESYKKISLLVINTLKYLLTVLNDDNQKVFGDGMRYKLFFQEHFQNKQIKLLSQYIQKITTLKADDNFETSLSSTLQALKCECKFIFAKELTKAIDQIFNYLSHIDFETGPSYKPSKNDAKFS